MQRFAMRDDFVAGAEQQGAPSAAGRKTVRKCPMRRREACRREFGQI
jgi:hypothetical protein